MGRKLLETRSNALLMGGVLDMDSCQKEMWIRFALEGGLILAYSGLEFWLGRTKRTEAASLIELILKTVLRKGTK